MLKDPNRKQAKYYKKKLNPKQKGSVFERYTAKTLSLWLSKAFYDDWLWRSQASGARYSIRKKQGLETFGQSGDISSSHPESLWFIENFHIECKAYKSVDLLGFITGMKGNKYLEWYSKAKDEAGKKTPLLFLKINSRPLFVLSSYNFIQKYNPLFTPVAIIKRPELTYAITLLDDFVKSDVDVFKSITLAQQTGNK